MPKVYVPNKGGHDYSAAEEIGKLVYVTSGTQYIYSTTNHFRAWEDALKDSSPDDYILVAGLTILNIIGATIFVAKHGVLNLAIYVRGKYMRRNFTYKDLPVENWMEEIEWAQPES